jgi:hypothetical protein
MKENASELTLHERKGMSEGKEGTEQKKMIPNNSGWSFTLFKIHHGNYSYCRKERYNQKSWVVRYGGAYLQFQLLRR